MVVQTCTKFSPIGSLQNKVNQISLIKFERRRTSEEKDAPVEHGVERRDLVHAHGRHLEQLRHVVHHADTRPSLILPLAEVEQGNDCRLLVLGRVLGDDGLRAFEVLRVELEGNLTETGSL